MEMTLDQQKAVAMATARLRLQDMPQPPQEADLADKLAGSIPGRIAIASGAPVIGIAQLAAHAAEKNPIVTAAQLLARKAGIDIPTAAGVDESVSHLKQMQDRGREASGSTGFDWASLAGSVMSPVSLASSGIPRAASVLGRIGQGTAIGAGFGAATPVTGGDFNTEKAKQTGFGAAAGGAISTALEGARGIIKPVYRALEPTFESGRAAILKRYQEGLLGDSKSRVIDAINNATTIPGAIEGKIEPTLGAQPRPPGELIKGSVPTVGEIVSNIPGATGLAAHQKAVSKVPGISGEFVARGQNQESARAAAIGSIAQDKAALATAEGKRAADALQSYTEAFGQSIKADPALAKMSKNPYFQDALPDAYKLAQAKGISPKDDMTQFLHIVKLSMDKALGRSGDTALSNTEKQAVATVKGQLVDWLGTKNPAYEVARSEFAKASVPINQMQVGQALEAKLVPPLGNTERAASFAQAVRDAPGTIKRSTGFNRYDDLGKILSPDQMNVVNALTEDLSRKAQYEKLAQGTNLTGATGITEGVQGVHLPNLLSRPAMIANFIMKKLGVSADDKINILAGKQYLDPQSFADALNVPKSKIVEAIMKAKNPAIAGAAYMGGH